MTWTEWLNDWVQNVYEPHFAPHGIEKGTALLTCQLLGLSQALKKHPGQYAEAFGEALQTAKRDLEDDKPWGKPE